MIPPNFLFSWAHIRLFFLGGIATGLPGVLTWQTLNIWLAQLGYSKSMIGMVFLSGIPYNFKMILSWFIDKWSVPILTPILGHRRSWAIVLQGLLAIFIILIGLTTGRIAIEGTIALCFSVSLLSAMNQIATVSHRIEQLDPEKSSPGVTAGIFGYRLGKFIGRAGALYLLTWLTWRQIYSIFGAILLIPMFGYGTTRDWATPKLQESISTQSISSQSFSWKAVIVEPFLIFSKSHSQWKLFLSLLCSLSLGDAFILGMSDLFYLEQGYTTIEIASITKVFGLICSLLGGLIAASVSKRDQIFKLLWLSSLIHMFSHIILIVLSLQPPHWRLLALSVMVEYLSAGMKATLTATWIGQLCSRSKLTGRQYAFFSSLKAIPFFLTAGVSGFVADAVIWPVFFIVSLIFALPAFIMLSILVTTISPDHSSKESNMLESYHIT